MKRIFSGIQPSGNIHIGNYIGAIKQWVELQDAYDNLFCIVDLHAITVRQDPVALRKKIRELAAIYIACGIDPERSVIFVQSSVPEHAQLAWVLNTCTQMGELERMTQYKDKSKKKQENANAGLFTYPVLMAADMLLYDTQLVPVGEDQTQHVELARDIAHRFNSTYGTDVLKLPEAYFPKQGARIMGLDDPQKKMSKSADSEGNYISLIDGPDVIRKKVKRAVTDSGVEVRAGEDKPAITNLLTIYSALSGKTVLQLENEYSGKGYGNLKSDLAEVIVSWQTPIRERVTELLSDTAALDAVLDNGQQRAQAIAVHTLRRVYDAVGLGYR